jgi:hypothetical protein
MWAQAKIEQLEKDLKSAIQSMKDHMRNAARANVEKCKAQARVRELEKQLAKCMPKDVLVLKKEHTYQTYEGKKIVFGGFNQSGHPIFQPLGEPSFEDRFIMTDPNWKSEIKRELGPVDHAEHYGEID